MPIFSDLLLLLLVLENYFYKKTKKQEDEEVSLKEEEEGEKEGKQEKEITAIPWWYIRTLISCLQKYNHEAKMKELRREEEQGIHLVVDRILPELFRRKVWEQKNVWTGILKVVKSFLHIDLVRKSPQLLDALLTIPSKPFLQQLCKEAMSNKNISYEKILIEHKKSKK